MRFLCAAASRIYLGPQVCILDLCLCPDLQRHPAMGRQTCITTTTTTVSQIKTASARSASVCPNQQLAMYCKLLDHLPSILLCAGRYDTRLRRAIGHHHCHYQHREHPSRSDGCLLCGPHMDLRRRGWHGDLCRLVSEALICTKKAYSFSV